MRTNTGGKCAIWNGWILWICLASVVIFPHVSKALIVDLDAYVDLAILQEDGINPLADGSWVFIIGSSNNVIDPMQLYDGTNYIANSVTGDDVILGMIQIPLNSTNNSGTFFTTVQYESDDINFVYIRFFDSAGPLTGMLWWGTSSIFQLGVTLGVATVQFDQDQQLIATNYNNFVIIPEPNTLNLFIMVAGMLGAMRVRMAALKRQENAEEESPPPSAPV
jgi:hypothetical protein